MQSWTWLRNTARNLVRSLLLNNFLPRRIWGLLKKTGHTRTVCITTATRLNEQDFWSQSPLGQSLPHLLSDNVSLDVKYNNSHGLPTIYNSAIQRNHADIIVFIHDDVWIQDELFIEKIIHASNIFDIVGVAGNTRILKKQPAWLFKEITETGFVWDHGHLSGVVRHGTPQNNSPMTYGPTPSKCELLDGVMIFGQRKIFIQSKTLFDDQFKFHFYDMDICRTARKNGLSLGTWPFEILHVSGGAFGSESWRRYYIQYLEKWKS